MDVGVTVRVRVMYGGIAVRNGRLGRAAGQVKASKAASSLSNKRKHRKS